VRAAPLPEPSLVVDRQENWHPVGDRVATDDERRARIASNEALFRAVNEKIESMNAAFATVVQTFTVVCECGDNACVEQIEIAVKDYERVRSDPTLFVVVPGHEIPDVEDVVERAEGFVLVKKKGGIGEEIAAATDPRE
jgi:hypothetical protein